MCKATILSAGLYKEAYTQMLYVEKLTEMLIWCCKKGIAARFAGEEAPRRAARWEF